jgi:hypothetical protein
MLRLLLRAAPAEDPAALRELNYAERRGAMYLLFSAAVLPGQLPGPLSVMGRAGSAGAG